MKHSLVDESWEDYLYWQQTNKNNLKRINELIKDIKRTPFTGIGKPEPLKNKYKGCWFAGLMVNIDLYIRLKEMN